MKNRILSLLCVLGTLIPTTFAQGLKDAYKDYFKVGVALNVGNLTPEQEAIVVREFNSVTCENAYGIGLRPTRLPTSAVATASR